MAITPEQYNDVVSRLEKLEQWVEQKKRQQITQPLDEVSKAIINRI